ncbi:DUF6634 family protein [Devosia sp. Root685]|uniref:DUF6634 family protein n=1 Tax=Devosia sp. Root685 TaxID=1736587 RepID=UPI0039B76F78
MKPSATRNPRADQIDGIGLLHQDLLRFSINQEPSDEELDAAPVLLSWQFGRRSVLCIEGVCGNHPTIQPGPMRTSQLWWCDPQFGWVRTQNRLYRLGTYSRR